jgi:O-antigen ligase
MSLAFLLPTLLTSTQRIVIVVQALLAGALLTSLFGLFQFAGDLAGLPQSITGLRDMYTKEVFGFPRVQSTALEPLYFANYLLLPIAICIVAILKRYRPLLMQSFITLPVMLPVFVLTLSRAAYIGALAMLFFLAIFLFRQFFSPSRVIVFVLVGVLTFFAVTYALSLTGEEDVSLAAFSRQATGLFIGASYADRLDTTQQAYALFKQHPFGIGPGNFGPSVAIHPLIEPKGGWLIVNNIYLEILVEEGVVGLAGFLAFCVLCIVGLLRSYKNGSDGVEQYLRIAVFTACIGILVQYLTFSILYIMHIWFAFGLALTLLDSRTKIQS